MTTLQQINNSLRSLSSEVPLKEGFRDLLNSLGYHSQRTLDFGKEEFVSGLTEKQLACMDDWDDVNLVFQLTDDEMQCRDNQTETNSFDEKHIRSFLFFVIELNANKTYSRGRLADMTRIVNKRFSGISAIVLFRYGEKLTLSTIHRRISKKEPDKDVLEKVTLIKDMDTDKPHRAHLEILESISLKNTLNVGINCFDALQLRWEEVLNINELNKKFYSELFEWYSSAVNSCLNRQSERNIREIQISAIRLITRLLFLWFIKEMKFLGEELFDREYVNSIIDEQGDDDTSYYRVILQNLFFGTLNTEIDKRIKPKGANGINGVYRHFDLLKDKDSLIEVFQSIPFVNGGLFDRSENTKEHEILFPSSLFFDENGIYEIFRRYKFTVEENTPVEEETALDPELLGRVFENLLATFVPETQETARKLTGSFYTPRNIVDYMVHQALVEAISKVSHPSDGDEAFWKDRIDYLLDYSDARSDAEEFFDTNEKISICSSILQLRILDPAVGSGAFVMGAFHKLMLALNRIDSENKLWKDYSDPKKSSDNGTVRYAVNEVQNRKRILDAMPEASVDYERKLRLVQNCIFGVDIQPIACQIAKLRFFISLVIEQELNPKYPNLGIRPLPNLETKIVAADTLNELENAGKADIQNATIRNQIQADEIDRLMDDIKENQKDYFYTFRNKDKEILKDRQLKLRIKLSNQLEQVAGWPEKTAKKLSKWNPYDLNTYTEWFDPEWMFGISDGFDVVLGNPPYISLQSNRGELRLRYQNCGYEAFDGQGDVYQLFIERSCDFLRRDGVLAFITSNSWLKADSGKKLRWWLSRKFELKKLIEAGKNVFENAIVDVSIFVLSRGMPANDCFAVDIEKTQSKRFPPKEEEWSKLHFGDSAPWCILSDTEQVIKRKIETIGTPLKDWDDISIYRGITTGANEAFVINKATKDALISDDPRSEEIIKPVLRGRDIQRYQSSRPAYSLITTFPAANVDIDNYPAVEKYLKQFGKERLEQSGQILPNGTRSRKKTIHKWFELQDTCAYHAKFQKEKIIWMPMSEAGRFCYSQTEMYCVNSAYLFFGESLKLKCAALNSNLLAWYKSIVAPSTGMGLTVWLGYVVERMPLPKSALSDSIRIEEAVDEMIDAISCNNLRRIDELTRYVNSLIFSLYELKDSEVRYINKLML